MLAKAFHNDSHTPPPHTGLHYREHGTIESQFLWAAIGFGLVPSSHYLTISFQEFPLTSPVSIYFMLVSCFNFFFHMDASAIPRADVAHSCV